MMLLASSMVSHAYILIFFILLTCSFPKNLMLQCKKIYKQQYDKHEHIS